MTDTWLLKEPRWFESEVKLLPLNRKRSGALHSPDSLTTSVPLLRGYSVMRWIRAQIFSFLAATMRSLAPDLIFCHPGSCNSLSDVPIPFTAPWLLFSNLKLFHGPCLHKPYFLNCDPWNSSLVGCFPVFCSLLCARLWGHTMNRVQASPCQWAYILVGGDRQIPKYIISQGPNIYIYIWILFLS